MDAKLLSSVVVRSDPRVFKDVPLLAGDELTLEDVSYVDDSVFPVMEDAAGLSAKVRRVAQVVHVGFLRHGMLVNYKPGKTEVVCVWSGKGMVAARQSMLIDGGSVIRCSPCRGGRLT